MLTLSNNRVESVYNVSAVRLGNNKSRQKFYGVTRVAGDLAKNFVFFEQWHGDELTEQTFS